MSRLLAIGLLVALTGLTTAQPPPPPPPPGPGGFDGGYTPYRPAAQQYKELVPGLIAALGDTDTEVRQHSAMALAALGKDAVPSLVDALKDKMKERRAGAAYALGQMGMFGRDAIPALLTALKDDEATVKRSAAHALSRILSQESGGFGHGYMTPMRPGRPIAAPGLDFPTAPPLPPPPKEGHEKIKADRAK